MPHHPHTHTHYHHRRRQSKLVNLFRLGKNANLGSMLVKCFIFFFFSKKYTAKLMKTESPQKKKMSNFTSGRCRGSFLFMTDCVYTYFTVLQFLIKQTQLTNADNRLSNLTLPPPIIRHSDGSFYI